MSVWFLYTVLKYLGVLGVFNDSITSFADTISTKQSYPPSYNF